MKWGAFFKALKVIGGFIAKHPEIAIAIVEAAKPKESGHGQ